MIAMTSIHLRMLGLHNDRSSTVLCMTDVDGDGFGAIEAIQFAISGTDCDDEDVYVYRGAAYKESALDCMRDEDGDGFGSGDVQVP